MMTKKEIAEAKAHAEHCAKHWTVSQLRSAFVCEYVYGRELFLKVERAKETIWSLSGKIGALNKALRRIVKACKFKGFSVANWRKKARLAWLEPVAKERR